MTGSKKSLLHLIIDFVLFCLMLLGVVGTMYKVLMPDGLLKAWMHEIWVLGVGRTLVIAVLALLAFVLARHWLDAFDAKAGFGNLVMYTWIALGLYFAFTLMIGNSY